MPVKNNSIQGADTLIFTDGGDTPVEVDFNTTTTTLDIGKFKKYLELQE
jgi:hypothetical protein